MSRYLENQLKKYSESGAYPFHMPGHKRREEALFHPYKLDITEIEGFDDLHDPEGILLEAQERLAKLYGSKESFFLVNGSTCGILASISAATKRGDKVLMARNCHRSVYHAAELMELETIYLYPAVTKRGIQGSVSLKEVEEALRKNPDSRAVILTSPTYDGILSDIRGIAELVHQRGIPLIVDEAHGAHLGFSNAFPASAVKEGADLVIQSFHKTLPSLTQTAVLHRTSDCVCPERIRKYLRIYQTSSPSYLLMASIDHCVRILEEKKGPYFAVFEANLKKFYENTKILKNLKILDKSDFFAEEVCQKDPSKILIYTGCTKITGAELIERLRKDWNLELEMASGYYALAMTSIMDSEEGFSRLSEALTAIDSQIESDSEEGAFSFMDILYGRKEMIYPVWKAESMPSEEVFLDASEGRIAAKTCTVYPPGIPVLLPGERIERDFLEKMKECQKKGLRLQGVSDFLEPKISVLAAESNIHAYPQGT